MPGQTVSPAARLLLGLLRLYKFVISPTLHGVMGVLGPVTAQCKFIPTCSEYAHNAIEIHGAVRGSWLALLRLLRCHPLSSGGLDPVPPRVFTPQHLP